MPILWYCLKRSDRRKLARYYEQQFGMKLVPPGREKRVIEVRVEDLEEIDRIMRTVPTPMRRG